MQCSAYIICATPRSGSTLLCDLLTATRLAGQPQSYFRSQNVAHWAERWGIDGSSKPTEPKFNRSYLAAMATAGAAGTGMFGLRLMWPSVAEATKRLAAASGSNADFAELFESQFGPTLFIHLSREDKVAQAVSLVRAEQTGFWHLAADGSERQRTAPAQAPIFDAGRIEHARDMLIAEESEWLRFFDRHRIKPLHLTYEQLAAEPQTALANTLTALGRDPAIASEISTQTAQMADAINASWIEQVKSNRPR